MDILCLLMTNEKCLFIAPSCENTVALQQQQCRHSRPKMGFQSPHEAHEFSCGARLYRCAVEMTGLERCTNSCSGNDSRGGKSKVSMFGMSQLSCLINGCRSISRYGMYRVAVLRSTSLVRNICKEISDKVMD